MSLENKLHAFATLGKFLKQFDSVSFNEDSDLSGLNELFANEFLIAIKEAEIYNPWFSREFILYSFNSFAEMLEENKLNEWVKNYPDIGKPRKQKLRVGIVMAGNIPLVGFHDFLSVCLSGHQAIVKMSSKDEKLLPLIYKVLCHCDSDFIASASILNEPIKNIDAVIATGSDNSARYFEYYFGKYPRLIRKNRNSAAILTGDESAEDYKKLADDIFLYFGMGCRNVSKIFIPVGFNIPRLLDNFETYSYLYNHNKYANNYDYHKAIYLVNLIKHYDTGYLLLKEDAGYSSPVGVVYYEFYDSEENLRARIEADEQKIQCLIGRKEFSGKVKGFGTSQRPGLTDYGDNADTLEFLLNLSKK